MTIYIHRSKSDFVAKLSHSFPCFLFVFVLFPLLFFPHCVFYDYPTRQQGKQQPAALTYTMYWSDKELLQSAALYLWWQRSLTSLSSHWKQWISSQFIREREGQNKGLYGGSTSALKIGKGRNDKIHFKKQAAQPWRVTGKPLALSCSHFWVLTSQSPAPTCTQQ